MNLHRIESEQTGARIALESVFALDQSPLLWTPKLLDKPSTWWSHVPFAFWITAVCKPRVLVELGTLYGVSYAAFCEAILRLRLTTRSYAIDSWAGDPQTGFYGDEVFGPLSSFHDLNFSAFSELLRMQFDEANQRFTDGTIDLLHLDGYHTYEAVSHDFNLWLPKLSNRGVVLFHDTNVHRDDFGVWRFFEELSRTTPCFEFLHGCGLGVACVGAEAPDVVQELCRLDDDAVAAVRERFSQLGAVWVSLNEALLEGRRKNELAAELAEEHSLIAEKDRLIAESDAQLADERDAQLAEKESLIAKMERLIVERAEELASRDAVIAKANALLSEKQTALDQKEAAFEENEEHYIRQLATLRRADYRGQLPSNLVGLRRLFPSSRRRKLRKLAHDYRILASSPLFDAKWYLTNNTDVAGAQMDPVLHYIRHGALEGRQPGPQFNAATYLSRYEDVATKNEIPLIHYILHGCREGRVVHSQTTTQRAGLQTAVARLEGDRETLRWTDQLNHKNQLIEKQSGDLDDKLLDTLDVSEKLIDYVSERYRSAIRKRWLRALRRRLRLAFRKPPVARSAYRLVSDSIFFDRHFYLAANFDVRAAGIDSVVHYLKYGSKEGRSPSPFFSEASYRDRYPDVAASGLSAIEHYERYGRAEKKNVRVAGVEPITHLARFVKSEDSRSGVRSNYRSYVEATHWNLAREKELKDALDSFRDRLPKISILMPVYETPSVWLSRAIESVQSQFYDNIELCVSDNSSPSTHVRELLDYYAHSDSRIKVNYRTENGHICRNTNDAFDLSSGEVIVLFDSDDELSWDALAEIAFAFAADPLVDYAYSDCDKITERGERFDPHVKPDWAPELLLTYMYAGQCLAVRRELWQSLGGMRVGYEGSQDHDFALRATELARKVAHIPRVLYHWRSHQGSTAEKGAQKPYSFDAGQRAVQDALNRRGVKGRVTRPEFAVKGGNALFEIRYPNDGPKVSIIIPTHTKVSLLEACLTSIAKTTYRNYEIVVIGNAWVRDKVEANLKRLGVKVLWWPGENEKFNFSMKMNWAVDRVDGDLVLLLNDDTEVVAPDWLSSMVGYLQMPGVGVVGALLRFPDGRVQHAGIVAGLEGGRCGHAFRLSSLDDRGYYSLISSARNCSGVTAACLLVPRSLYVRLGGFNETEFAVAYNDPDFCYRAHDLGYRIVYTPNAELIHYEGATRGFGDDPDEEHAYLEKYSERRDPYYNPNFSTAEGNFRFKPTNVPVRQGGKFRVAFVSHNMNWEGAPQHLLHVVTGLKALATIDPVVFSLSSGPLATAFEANGVTVKVLPPPPGWDASLVRYASWLSFVRGELAKSRVSAVFANTLECFFAVDAASQLSIPSIWNVHESEGEGYFEGWSSETRKIALKCFSSPYRVIFVANSTKDVYAALDTNNNAITIKNGYVPASGTAMTRTDARMHLGVPEEAVLFLSVGTVSKRKSQLDIVLALSTLLERGANIERLRLIIVGDQRSDYSEELHFKIDALPSALKKRINVVAKTSDVQLYYAAADVFICSSRIESYPLVILEAMGAGLPIIATPVFGIAEQVKEHRNALFFTPGDFGQLATHVQNLLENDAQRVEFGRYSRRQLRSLPSKRTMMHQYEDTLRQACTASVFRDWM